MLKDGMTLDTYLKELKEGKHHFENVFESLARMIFDDPANIKPIIVNGRSSYDFLCFRKEKKHIIGLYDVINNFVAFIKDGAENGESKEMAFVLLGEPGNGKTFFVDYLSDAFTRMIPSGKILLLYSKALEFINQQIIEHRKAGNLKLSSRYGTLLNYFEHQKPQIQK